MVLIFTVLLVTSTAHGQTPPSSSGSGEAQKAAPGSEKAETPPAGKSQTVTRGMKKEDREKMKEEIKEEVLRETREEIRSVAVPEWTKRIHFNGDIRLRYEGDFFASGNADFLDPNNPTQLLNSHVNRDRFRVRARLGATADVNEKTEAGIRLTTGNLTNPVTTNQTMGNYENKYSVVMDLAYLKLKPLPELTLVGGRIANPFFYSNLIWYDDLTFDGFAVTYAPWLTKSLGPFVTLGAFPLQEIEFSTKDKWLFAGQAGVDYQPQKGLGIKVGVAYYHYQNTQGVPNDPSRPGENDYTAPLYMQKGNTLFDIDPSSAIKLALAAEYRELDFIATVDFSFWEPYHIILLADYVKNIGFDRSQVAALTGNPNVQEATVGYQFGLSVGYPLVRAYGRWRVYGYYKYLEADAVLDAFTDPDFHLGGTNAKGWVIGGELGLAKNLWFSARYLSANEISGPPFGVDVLQIDLNGRF